MFFYERSEVSGACVIGIHQKMTSLTGQKYLKDFLKNIYSDENDQF